jgi:hypothetical protein
MNYDTLRTRLTNGKQMRLIIPQDMSAEDWRLLSEYVALQKEASFDDDYDERPVEEQAREIVARYAPSPAHPNEDTRS